MIDLKFINAQESNSVHGNGRDCFYNPNIYLLSKKNTYICTLFFCNKHHWIKMCLAKRCLNRMESKQKEQRDSMCVIELDRLLGMNIQRTCYAKRRSMPRVKELQGCCGTVPCVKELQGYTCELCICFAHLGMNHCKKECKRAMGLTFQDIDPSFYATTEVRSSVAGIPSSLRCWSSNSSIAH
jgi:hypothetical protein